MSIDFFVPDRDEASGITGFCRSPSSDTLAQFTRSYALSDKEVSVKGTLLLNPLDINYSRKLSVEGFYRSSIIVNEKGL